MKPPYLPSLGCTVFTLRLSVQPEHENERRCLKKGLCNLSVLQMTK